MPDIDFDQESALAVHNRGSRQCGRHSATRQSKEPTERYSGLSLRASITVRESAALPRVDGVADRLLSLTVRELARKQSLALLLSRAAQERVIGFIIEMAQHGLSKGDRIALPMTRQDIADYLGLTIETVSRILHDLERRGTIKINGYRSIALRNQFVERRAEELPDLFEDAA
jgi:CRP-like cAMP-binding protein